MGFSSKYKFYKMQSTTLNISRSILPMHHIIPILHLACLTVILVLIMEKQLDDAFDGFSDLTDALKNDYLTVKSAQVYAMMGNGINAVMIVIALVTLRMMSSYDEVSLHTTWQTVLSWCSLCAFYLAQVMIYLVCWSFTKICFTQGFPSALAKCSLPLLYYIYSNYKYETSSLFGWQTVPIILLLTLPPTPIYYVLIILQLIYLLFMRKGLTKKVCIGVGIVMVLFVMMNSTGLVNYDMTESEQDSPVSFLCLGVLVVLVAIIVVKAGDHFVVRNEYDMAVEIFETLDMIKGQAPSKALSFHKYFNLYNNLFRLVLANKQYISSQEIQGIIEKHPQNLSKHDCLLLLQKYLQKQSKTTARNNTLYVILLIKVRMELDHSITSVTEDLFLIGEELERTNGQHLYEFYELFDLVIEKYAVFKSKQVQTSLMRYTNSLHERLERDMLQILDRVNMFWKSMTSKELSLIDVQATFRSIYQEKDKLDHLYEQILKFHHFKKERITMGIIQYMLNSYKAPKQSTSELSISAKEEVEQETLAFLVLENSTIKFVSKDFLKSLGKKDHIIYENVDKRELFGDQLVSIVDNLIRQISHETQNQWITVPILCHQNCVKLKKINVLWTPSLEIRNKFMIRFMDDDTLQDGCFLVYHFQTDTIKYFNEHFIKNFSIIEQNLTFQLNNYKLFFNQLFGNSYISLDQIKKSLKEGNRIKCNIHLKKYIERGLLNTFPVEIVASKCIDVDGQLTYGFLKVQKFWEKQQLDNSFQSETCTMSKNNFCVHEVNQAVLSQESLAKKYEHEEFFCQLPNLYEGKITQKQSQLQEEGRFTYRNLKNVLFLLLIVILLTFWSLQCTFLDERVSQYRDGLKSIENTSEQYAILLQAYSVGIKRYYFQKQPAQTLATYHIPGFVFDSIYAGVEQNFLNQFMDLYLTQIRNPPNNPVNYEIDFKKFSINTTTWKTTMMDFAENFRKHVTNSDIDFLLKNYYNFRSLTVGYETAFNSQQKISDIQSQYEIYLWILLALASILLLLMTLILCKLETTINMVYGLIEKMDNKEIKAHMSTFNEKKDQVLKILYQSNFSFNASTNGVNNMATWTTLSQPPSDSIRPIESGSYMQINPQNSKGYTKIMDTSANQNEKEKLEQATEKLPEQTQPLSRKIKPPVPKQVIGDPFVYRAARKSPFIVLILILMGIFFLDRSWLVYERDGMIQLYEMKQQFYVSLLHVKRLEVDAPIVPIMRDYFNDSTITDRTASENVDLVASIPTKIILKELGDFQNQVFDTLTADMCHFIGSLAHVALKPCQSYLKGFVGRGFKEAFDQFVSNARILANESISDFNPYPCTVNKCSPYAEHEFGSILMGETSRYLVKLLSQSTEIVFEKFKENCKFRIMMKVVGLLVTCLLYMVYWSYMRCKCRTTLQFFTMIPRSIMCSLKMTIFLRKHNFLDKLDIL